MCDTCIKNFKKWWNNNKQTSSAIYEGDDPHRVAMLNPLYEDQQLGISQPSTVNHCPFAKAALLPIVNTTHNAMNALYVSSALYVFWLTYIKQLEIEQCGLDNKNATAFNTMWLSTSTVVWWFLYTPMKNYAVSKGFAKKGALFTNDYLWAQELEEALFDAITSFGFVTILADQFRKDQHFIKIVLYIACCRGFVKGLILLLGATVVKENKHWILRKFEALLLDNILVSILSEGVSFASSLTACVITGINYIYNARHGNYYPEQVEYTTNAAIAGFAVASTAQILDAMNDKGYFDKLTESKIPACIQNFAIKPVTSLAKSSLNILSMLGLLCNFFYYIVNLIVSVAMCDEGEPLGPEKFKEAAPGLDSSLIIMMLLAMVSIFVKTVWPAMPLMAPEYDKSAKYSGPFRYALKVAFGRTLGIADIPLGEVHKMLKSHQELTRWRTAHNRVLEDFDSSDDELITASVEVN